MLVDWMDRTLYPRFQKNWDDEELRRRILEVLEPSDRVLELGAGAGVVQQMRLKSVAAEVCGVDLDPRVLDNPHLDEARIGDAAKIPYDDEAFDVVIANNVLEHLASPEEVFREVARVLRPGGLFLAKTPNAFHYVPLVARLTPHRLHQVVNSWRGRSGEDTFRTLYRANTARRLRSCAGAAGLEGRPEYLRFNAATYLLGWLYERLVNSAPFMRSLRGVLIVVLAKPMPPEA